MTDPLLFVDPRAFRSWLESNAATESELLVAYHKVATGQQSMSWSESVDEALCFGWIDGRRNRIDKDTYSIRFTPRKPSSIWSAVNIAKVERLRTEGRMTPAGEQAFALRSVSRSGVYYHEQVNAAELSVAEVELFRCDQIAWEFFEAASPGYKKRILHWVNGSKKEETRASRLSKLVQACAAGVRLP